VQFARRRRNERGPRRQEMRRGDPPSAHGDRWAGTDAPRPQKAQTCGISSSGGQAAGSDRAARRTALAPLLAALAVLLACQWPAPAAAAGVDGISDQSLPLWDGSFAASPLAGALAQAARGGAGVQLARYVLQWDAAGERSAGASAAGDYRERFEAWLADVRAIGLRGVLALTSYDGVRPGSASEYARSLDATLALAAAAGLPIAYLEPWNEPNGQGGEAAAAAAGLADAASGICRARGCTVIAGDFADNPGLPAYERAYERALTSGARDWGVHPYISVATHSTVTLARFRRELPGGGRNLSVWFTEVGALSCNRGEGRGEARQAADAAYLRDTLMRDPGLAPAHAIYYGLMFADRRPAPCSRAGGADSELFSAGGRPRAAALVLLPAVASLERSLLFGPGPGSQPAVSGGSTAG
jgi:hypothetical protein